METALRLLMRDGAAHLTFRPKLNGEHYSELLRATEYVATRAELQTLVESLADQWGTEVTFDEF